MTKTGRKVGRKSLRDETVQANVINLSWTTILRALHSKLITDEEKRGICLKIVERTCPKEINLKGDSLITNVYSVIEQVQRDIHSDRIPSLALDSGDGDNER